MKKNGLTNDKEGREKELKEGNKVGRKKGRQEGKKEEIRSEDGRIGGRNEDGEQQ